MPTRPWRSGWPTCAPTRRTRCWSACWLARSSQPLRPTRRHRCGAATCSVSPHTRPLGTGSPPTSCTRRRRRWRRHTTSSWQLLSTCARSWMRPVTSTWSSDCSSRCSRVATAACGSDGCSRPPGRRWRSSRTWLVVQRSRGRRRLAALPSQELRQAHRPVPGQGVDVVGHWRELAGRDRGVGAHPGVVLPVGGRPLPS